MELAVWNGNLVQLLLATVFAAVVTSYLKLNWLDLVSVAAARFEKLGSAALRDVLSPPGKPSVRWFSPGPLFFEQASRLL